MSVLSQKLQEASRLFQNHQFKKSLEAYEDCIDFCHRTKEERSVLFNILSTKATLEYILGDYDKALTTLNSVLGKDPSHFLCLLRRSQVYKKKSKLKKALKDLEAIHVYCPDNLQVSAFKAEIEHLLLVNGSTAQQSSDSSDEEIQNEQQAQLNFLNLKMIDRKSSDISASNKRKSRVTILGDTTFEYKSDEKEETEKTSGQDKEDISERAIRTYKQIELDMSVQGSETESISIKVSAPKNGKRSILKNKGTSIFIQPQDENARQSKYLGRESKLLKLLKDIDGKFIHSGELEHQAAKDVMFRKSVSQTNPLEQIFDPTASVMSNKSANSETRNRKSCLKRPSFQFSEPRKARTSRFEQIDATKIDGKLIIHKAKHRHSIENKPGEDVIQESSDSDNESSSHNIFGSKGVVMTPDLREKLGLPDDHGQQMTKSLNLGKKHSILKKNSSLIMSSSSKKSPVKQDPPMQEDSGQKAIRAKKSVMFNCTL